MMDVGDPDRGLGRALDTPFFSRLGECSGPERRGRVGGASLGGIGRSQGSTWKWVEQ